MKSIPDLPFPSARKLATLLLFSVGGCGLSTANPVWTENFDGLSAGAGITTGNTAFSNNNLSSGTSATAVVDAAEHFGQGPANVLVRLLDGSSTGSARLGYDAGTTSMGSKVVTLSFRFKNDSGFVGNNVGFRLSTAADAWTNYNVQLLFNRAADGTGVVTTGGASAETFPYDRAVVNHVQVIANNSATVLADYHGTEDLAPGKVDIWINGVLVGDDIEFTDIALGNTNTNFRSLSIQSFNAPTSVDFLLDDLAVYASAYVTTPPEPQPGNIALSAANYSVAENAGSVTVSARRSGGSFGAVSVDYTTGDGSASAGTDYTTASGTLHWADGIAGDKSFTVAIFDNGVYTGDRSFTVTLSNPGGDAILGTPDSAMITILEDEPMPPPPEGAPAWVSADPASETRIVLTWDDNTADETGFAIERAASPGGPWALVQTSAADADVWSDSGLSAGTGYFYRISVVGGANHGATSAAVSASTLPSGDSLARMRQNALNFWRAIGASRSGARLADALATLSDNAQSALDTIQPNGSWTDVDYSDVIPDATWSLDLHYNRLQDLARAWATPGAALYQDVATRTAMLNAIDYIETVVNSSSNLGNGNWWWWQIGIPERYGPALVLLREELGAERLNRAAATLDYLIGPTLRNGTEGSQNWIWQGTNRIYHGLLAGNAGSITQGAGFIADYVFIATPGVNNGIMPDYAFHAHGGNVSTGYRSQLATGQYGASFMRYVPQFTFFAEGTSYQLTPAMQQILADFALEGSRWTVFGQFMDISVEGRAYTRDNRNAQNPLAGLLALANTPGSPAQSEAAASAMRILQDWTLPLRPEEAGLAGQLETMAEVPAQPVGFRPYNFSDYAVARTDDWFISLKTISDRNLIGESINGENLRGRHLASGVTWILTGDEYRLNNVIPTLDHQRLPGTTVEAGLDLGKTYHYAPGLRSFVGGASIGGSGTSAMDFHSRSNFPGESDLEAKKSWFFFGDSMVALGSGISATTNRRVETIVNQRPMPTIGDAITVDGVVQTGATGITSHNRITWAHEGAVGYVFPGGADVRLKRANQSGRWSDIGSRSSDLHSNPMFSLWFDHGTAPGGASYAYAVLPNANAATTQAAAENNTFEVLAQTTVLHAVKHHGDNAVGAVFWQAGEIDRVRVDTPSVVFWDINGSTLELALSEPGHNSTIVELTFAGELTPVSLPAGVTIQVSGGSTFISYEVENGRNYDCTFSIDSLGSLPSPGSAGYLSWAGDYNLSGADALPGADPDRDGINNFLERALGGNPRIPFSAAMPVVAMDSLQSGSAHLILTATKDPSATDVAFIAETSTDFGSWNGVEGVDIVTLIDTPESLQVRTAATVNASDPRRFLRLRVEPASPEG